VVTVPEKASVAQFTLEEIFHDIRSDFSNLLNAKSLVLNVNIPETAMVLGNKRLFHHALANLISNAIKYSPKAGTISVTAIEEPTLIIIRVKDQGPEIPLEQHKHIFQKSSVSRGKWNPEQVLVYPLPKSFYRPWAVKSHLRGTQAREPSSSLYLKKPAATTLFSH